MEDYVVSNGRKTDEKWIENDTEGNSRGPTESRNVHGRLGKQGNSSVRTAIALAEIRIENFLTTSPER